MPPKKQQKTSILDLERLVDPLEKDLDKDLLCQICMDIVQQPQECKVCQSIYCLECANDWKKKKNNCPNQCKGAWKMQDPHKKYRAELAALKFKCFYEDKGCQVRVTFETYEKHEETCSFKNGAVGNTGSNGAQKQQSSVQQHTFGSGAQQQQQQSSSQQSSQQQQVIKKAKFSCETDSGWVDYEEKFNEIFEKNHQKNVKTFKCKIGQWDYTINLVKMLQINQSTKKQRKIKREGPVFSQPQPQAQPQQQQPQQQQPQQQQQQQQSNQAYDPKKIRFCFKGDNGNWQTFDTEISKEMEKNFQVKKSKFMLKLGSFDYDIDLDKMIQVNRTSKKQRQIMRKDFNVKNNAAQNGNSSNGSSQQQQQKPQQQQQIQQQQQQNSDISDNEEQKSEELDHRWQWQNTDYGIIKWENFNDLDLEEKLEEAYDKYSTSSTRNKGNIFPYDARGNKYQIDFKKMEQTNMNSKYKRKVKRIKSEDYESD